METVPGLCARGGPPIAGRRLSVRARPSAPSIAAAGRPSGAVRRGGGGPGGAVTFRRHGTAFDPAGPAFFGGRPRGCPWLGGAA